MIKELGETRISWSTRSSGLTFKVQSQEE